MYVSSCKPQAGRQHRVWAMVTGSTSGQSTREGQGWGSYRKTQQQARLPYSRIADEQQLRGPKRVSSRAHKQKRKTRRKTHHAGQLTLNR